MRISEEFNHGLSRMVKKLVNRYGAQSFLTIFSWLLYFRPLAEDYRLYCSASNFTILNYLRSIFLQQYYLYKFCAFEFYGAYAAKIFSAYLFTMCGSGPLQGSAKAYVLLLLKDKRLSYLLEGFLPPHDSINLHEQGDSLRLSLKSSVSTYYGRSVVIVGPKSMAIKSISGEAVYVYLKPSQINSPRERSILFVNREYSVSNWDSIAKEIGVKYSKVVVRGRPVSENASVFSASEMQKFYCSDPLALNRALFNICNSRQCEYIHLDGFDYYLGAVVYSPEYISSVKRADGSDVDVSKMMRSLALHDVLFNFLLTKEFFAHNKGISASEDLISALRLSADEFLEKFCRARKISCS